MRPYLVAAAGMATAFVVAVAVPAVGLWALPILIPVNVIEGRMNRGFGRCNSG